jgi:NADH:ubiquinone oxidoreductase subunit 5 (subunit L)/multisubunit Na+/H+ antiporter MnhA subunit
LTYQISPSTDGSDPPAADAFGHWRRTLRSIERLSTTRANGYAGLVADTGVAAALLMAAARQADAHLVSAAPLVAIGVLVFSLVEYSMHRWLFHGSVAIFEQGHRKHHEQPEAHDSLPFFLPPLAMLALAAVLAGLIATTPALWLSGGIAAGYAAYGLTHTAFHALRFRQRWAQRWAAAHHIHHHHAGSNFGVTSPLWDLLLQTRYVSARHRSLG